MKINNPQVTLADEARNGVKEDVRSGFLDWLFRFNVYGDDGNFYSLGGSILSLALEKLDVVSFGIAKGFGGYRQLPNSIYTVTNFPGSLYEKLLRKPQGTLNIDKQEDKVVVTCDDEFKVICYQDKSWNFIIDSLDGKYKANLIHKPYGYPLWYGREEPSYLTQHSITYGYNWAGEVYGYFEYEGKRVNVKGSGQRERYVAVDSSAAELGAWEDWGYVTFDDIHTSFYDMRAGMKDFAVYDIKNNKYYPQGELNITHLNWAFMRELDGFIPQNYNIIFTLEDGTLEVNAHVANGTTWGVTYKTPDNPVATLIFDKVDGTFTYNDGTVRQLSGGSGALSVRQWHAYPSVLPRELYSDEVLEGEKFDTL